MKLPRGNPRIFPLLSAGVLGLSAVTGTTLLAQPQYAQPSPYSQFAQAPDAGQPGQLQQLPPLQQLLAPIALYPDPLIALILPAATEPEHVRWAATAISANNDPDELASKPWGDAVKDLAHYPDVTHWMADNIPWTQQVGAAFAQQPQAVMDAIQDLRRRALQSGALQSTPQQQVVQDGGAIQIVPAQQEALFVPRYDPDEVFFAHGPGNYFSWSEARPAGAWLGFYPDWSRHSIWVGDWREYHRGGGEHRFSVGGFGISIGHGGGFGHEWRVADDAQIRQYRFSGDDRRGIARPGVIDGAPGGARYGYNREDRYPGDRYRNDRRDDHDRATFPGDDVRRRDQDRHDEDRSHWNDEQRRREDDQRRYEDQHRFDQNREDERYRDHDDGGSR